MKVLTLFHLILLQTRTTGALNEFEQWFHLVGNALIAIFVIYGVIKCVGKFMQSSPDKMSSLMWVVVGIAVWASFNLWYQDITDIFEA